jgi:threo-3-hydroxy-L-aspartate ammonia-lyase
VTSHTELTTPVRDSPLTIEAVRAAAQRISGIAHRTAITTCAALDGVTGAQVIMKPEQFQRSGSFKFRGAYNRLAQMNEAERQAGVVAYSSGNHGAAVALAASLLHIPATVVVPEGAAAAKLTAIEAFGAGIRAYHPENESRELIAENIAEATGAVLVPPFEDYEVMAGQGTLALEMVADAGGFDMIIVPVGGGGLIAGVATVIDALLPDCRIIGVEPAAADDTFRSLMNGRVETCPGPPQTIADGLRTLAPGAHTFAINQRLVDEVVLVSEEAIVAAMRFCFEQMKFVVEPSGAVGVAALLTGAVQGPGLRTGVVLSGGNVSATHFADLMTSEPSLSSPSSQTVRPNKEPTLSNEEGAKNK